MTLEHLKTEKHKVKAINQMTVIVSEEIWISRNVKVEGIN